MSLFTLGKYNALFLLLRKAVGRIVLQGKQEGGVDEVLLINQQDLENITYCWETHFHSVPFKAIKKSESTDFLNLHLSTFLHFIVLKAAVPRAGVESCHQLPMVKLCKLNKECEGKGNQKEQRGNRQKGV